MIRVNESADFNELTFGSEKEALDYAEKNIGKWDWELATVEGKDAILTSTVLPYDDDFYSFAGDMLAKYGFDEDQTAELRDELLTAFENTVKAKFLTVGLEY